MAGQSVPRAYCHNPDALVVPADTAEELTHDVYVPTLQMFTSTLSREEPRTLSH